ncbi:phenylacetate--CoA ligase family protein [Mycolicibacterium sarraceniae]|uniref:Capsular polysaccharide biosynthesis protein CapK n=1 Tax=Mycolicibacterium sarraceniae TaxID=1534348 RepID=A0A7I7STH1_9MYCO|nr:phenylacetate--CoA ligase family protein [Mycolicibacterium sarraceniae]BBY59345.1 capsular polysaccharide biosynthesis protein CapK [Mycolicibacterium sarraceniae]
MLHEMESREQWSPGRMAAYQSKQLEQLLRICSTSVPYYVDLFRHEGLDLDRLSPNDMLSRVPPLEKSEIRRDPEKFLNTRMHRWLLHETCTSGTTGTPLVCWRDLPAINFENATLWRQRRWAGFSFHDRRVTLRGEVPVSITRTTPPYWRYDPAERQLVMSSHHLGPRTASDYATALSAFAPQAVEGYPNSLAVLARLLRSCGIEHLPVKAVFTSSEMVLDSYRRVFEDFYCAPVFDHYGTSERAAAISSCEQGRYHVLPDYAVVEFGEGGEIIGTPLFNHAFPLLRYRTGDAATLEQETACPCGRSSLPVVSQIQGRLDSQVVTPDGKIAGTAALSLIYKGVHHIVESQIVQESAQRVVLKIVREHGYTPNDEQILLCHARERLGHVIDIAVEYVDRIPRTASGKFVAVVGMSGNTTT